jgi:hypothetical protein
VRTREDESDAYPARLFIPSVPDLLDMANRLEQEISHVLLEAESEDRDREKGIGDAFQEFDLVLPAVDAGYLQSILSGRTITAAELARVQALMEQAGIRGGVSPTQIAQLLRLAGAPVVVGTAHVDMPTDSPHYKDRDALRSDVSRLVRSLKYETGLNFPEVWGRLYDAVPAAQPIKTASVEVLRHCIDVLSRWRYENG